jgi:hypothetical protein
LEPILNPSGRWWQNQSYSEIRVNSSGGYAIIQSFEKGNYMTIWTKNLDWYLGQFNWQQDSLYRAYRIFPMQFINLIWEMNMTIPFYSNFTLNLQWCIGYANRSIGFPPATPPFYFQLGQIQIYNYHTNIWDSLVSNIVGNLNQGLNYVTDSYFPIDYSQYVSATSRNITVRMLSGEGQNTSANDIDIQIGFAGAFTEMAPYRCQNYTGIYQSEVTQLPAENTYYWDNFTVDLQDTSIMTGIDQIQPLMNNLGNLGDGMWFRWFQSFQPQESDYIAITVGLSKQGNPIDALEMILYEFNGLVPIGIPLAASFVAGASLPPFPGWIPYTFTIKYHLNVSKQYCFVLERNGMQDPLNYYLVVLQMTNAYPPGFAAFDTGIFWQPQYTSDLLFITEYFVDSYIRFEYRNSTNGITWSSWNSIYHRYSDFSRHTFSIPIHQNRTQYLQWQIKFYSNHPGYLPWVFNVTFGYISYLFNYTMTEYDRFDYQFLSTPETIYQIKIQLNFNFTFPPIHAKVLLYNIPLKQWNLLASNFNDHIWYLKGSNLTTYYNGSLYLAFWCDSIAIPIDLVKTKQITFYWDYYICRETDIFDFAIADPVLISLNTSYYCTSKVLDGSVDLLNTSNQQWTFLSLQNFSNYEIPLSYYNGSIILYTEVLLLDDDSPLKDIRITVFYMVTEWPDWLTWVIVIGAISGTIAVLTYARVTHIWVFHQKTHIILH